MKISEASKVFLPFAVHWLTERSSHYLQKQTGNVPSIKKASFAPLVILACLQSQMLSIVLRVIQSVALGIPLKYRLILPFLVILYVAPFVFFAIDRATFGSVAEISRCWEVFGKWDLPKRRNWKIYQVMLGGLIFAASLFETWLHYQARQH